METYLQLLNRRAEIKAQLQETPDNYLMEELTALEEKIRQLENGTFKIKIDGYSLN